MFGDVLASRAARATDAYQASPESRNPLVDRAGGGPNTPPRPRAPITRSPSTARPSAGMATDENNHKNEARDDWTGCTYDDGNQL